jgi:hypothetical protein
VSRDDLPGPVSQREIRPGPDFGGKLRTGRSLRYSRRRTDRRGARFVTPSYLIDKRPAAVEERTRIADWEGDLIVGTMNRSAIGTLVDRTSRYVRLILLPDGHRADQLRQAIEPVLGRPPGGRPANADLGPGHRDGPPSSVGERLQRRHLLRHPRLSLAAWHQREHQQTAPAVLPDLYVAQRCRGRIALRSMPQDTGPRKYSTPY